MSLRLTSEAAWSSTTDLGGKPSAPRTKGRQLLPRASPGIYLHSALGREGCSGAALCRPKAKLYTTTQGRGERCTSRMSYSVRSLCKNSTACTTSSGDTKAHTKPLSCAWCSNSAGQRTYGELCPVSRDELHVSPRHGLPSALSSTGQVMHTVRRRMPNKRVDPRSL